MLLNSKWMKPKTLFFYAHSACFNQELRLGRCPQLIGELLRKITRQDKKKLFQQQNIQKNAKK